MALSCSRVAFALNLPSFVTASTFTLLPLTVILYASFCCHGSREDISLRKHVLSFSGEYLTGAGMRLRARASMNSNLIWRRSRGWS